MDRRFQIFVSSTYADLQEERQKVIQTLMEMDCIPAGMELFPAADEEQWAFIRRIIDDCDYYILVIGGRYGSLTAEGISYTEKEYDYAISINLKVLAFLHEKPDEIPLGKSDTDPTLRQKLEDFRQKVSKNRLVKSWRKASDLPGLIALSLSKTIKAYPAVGWVRANNVASGELLADINDLRKENSNLKVAIDRYESQFSTAEMDLAGLDDSITVGLEWKYYSRGSHFRKTGEATVTWGELFARIAPDLQTHPSDYTVKKKLGSSLYRINEPDSTTSALVRHEDFQTIRIQLSTLGLIQTKYNRTTKGGADLFWTLTNRGSRLMTQLRTVKAKPGGSKADTV